MTAEGNLVHSDEDGDSDLSVVMNFGDGYLLVEPPKRSCSQCGEFAKTANELEAERDALRKHVESVERLAEAHAAVLVERDRLLVELGGLKQAREPWRTKSEDELQLVTQMWAERDKLKAEVERLRKDREEAAGELLLPIPTPGSDMAKVQIANRLLGYERDQLRSQLAVAVEALDYLAKHGVGAAQIALAKIRKEES
jgi:hypothetical protein